MDLERHERCDQKLVVILPFVMTDEAVSLDSAEFATIVCFLNGVEANLVCPYAFAMEHFGGASSPKVTRHKFRLERS